MISIDIMEDVLDAKYWRYEPARKRLSGHYYRNSPFESDDSCGNCNGAYCDFCKEITIDAHLEFAMYSDELCRLLEFKGVPYDNASEIAYSDFCRNNTSGNYHLIYPNRLMLKKRYPDVYEKILAEKMK